MAEMTPEPGPTMTDAQIDAIKIEPDWKVIRNLVEAMFAVADDGVEELAMDLVSTSPDFNTDMIESDTFMDGAYCRLTDRIWKVLAESISGSDS